MSLGRLRWALRKARLPVSRDALVLDVGSGGKPYPRSDVLLDRVSGAEHRQGNALVIDRPTVLGDASRMPFKSKAFDFVVASHILEHMAQPEIFLAELMRVAKAGYIETPNAVYERLNPFSIHCLEVQDLAGQLVIQKKSSEFIDKYFNDLKLLKNHPSWQKQMRDDPSFFHTCLYWRDEIPYWIVNPEVNCQWIEDINDVSESHAVTLDSGTAAGGWRKYGLIALSSFQSRRRKKRLAKFSLESILACPNCLGDLDRDQQTLCCRKCAQNYPMNPLPDFTVSSSVGDKVS